MSTAISIRLPEDLATQLDPLLHGRYSAVKFTLD
jgi:predicted transcriptional regulator